MSYLKIHRRLDSNLGPLVSEAFNWAITTGHTVYFTFSWLEINSGPQFEIFIITICPHLDYVSKLDLNQKSFIIYSII